MELSTTADWLGVLGGLALGFGWLWKLRKWLTAKVAETNDGAVRGGRLVAELLDLATTPARRADIHAYIQFRCAEIEGDRTRRLIHLFAMGTFFVGASLLLFIVWRLFDVDSTPWLWWLSVTNHVAMVVAFAMLIFFSAQLSRLDDGWQLEARKVLGERAFRHASKVENSK